MQHADGLDLLTDPFALMAIGFVASLACAALLLAMFAAPALACMPGGAAD